MVLGPALALDAVSTTYAVVVLLALAFELREERPPSARRSQRWAWIFLAVNIFALGFVFSLTSASYWSNIQLLYIQYKSSFPPPLVASAFTACVLIMRLMLEKQQIQGLSCMIKSYLLICIVCDIAYTFLQLGAPTSYSVLLRCCVHSVLLICRRRVGSPISGHRSRHHAPEELHSSLGRVFYSWINPILHKGYRNNLLGQDIPPLSQDVRPAKIRTAITFSWSQRAKPETEGTLPHVLVTCFKAEFSAAIVPRFFLIVFRYSQPVLMEASIRYVATSLPHQEMGRGYLLILSAIAISLGRAVSMAIYRQKIDKLKLITRSALIGLIHEKAMKSPNTAYEDGKAITLMSTDAESLDGLAEMIHETWAQIIEVLIGVILLANGIGWIWPFLLFLIYLCSHMSRYVAKHLEPRQKEWNTATQNRIAATSSVISSMKFVKMLGLQERLNRRIQELRSEELWIASRLRWIVVWNNASANALGIFSPAITLVLFAALSAAHSRGLDTGTAYSTITLLPMITHPANMIMTIVPRAVGAFAGLKRIQAFLLEPSLDDKRDAPPRRNLNGVLEPAFGSLTEADLAIHIQQLSIGRKELILENVNLKMKTGSFTIISGPTGCGKSTLLRAILGEVTPAHGLISLSTRRIAYCSQRPWIQAGTIREAICGFVGEYDEAWYYEVINACCLVHDIDSLRDGDHTQIGSRGLNLSGGQRQRVALARALFARCDILVADDTFSGLDGDTEQALFDNLFSATGLTRRLRTTVVLTSNSAQYFRLADHIVVLGHRGIVDQGSWQDLKFKATSIAKFSSGRGTRDDTILSANFDKLRAQVRVKDETEIDLARKTGDFSLYAYYFRSIGFISLFLLVALTTIYSIFITIPQYWLQLWTEERGRNSAFYTYGFLFLSFMAWISTSFQMWSIVIRLAPRSGLQLHRRLLNIIMSAPLSFFSQSDNGSILNRFTQDIQLIDKQLPSMLGTVVTQILKLLLQVIVLCMAEKWVVVSLPAGAVIVYTVQKVYLKTSRQLRFLELQSQAGVFSNFLESIEGIEITRSFGWSKAVVQENTQRVDTFQRTAYLLMCLQGWLNLVLDLLGAAVASGIVAIAVFLRGTISGAQVGIALNIMLVANTTLLKLVESWTGLETSLGPINRLKTLEASITSESLEGLHLEHAENWPSKGDIQFKDVTASYQSGSTVLHSVNLHIPAGQKLIICGRTGSGKSTMLLTLLRLLELKSGRIEIDGLDIKHVSLDILRQRCFVAVSQDPLLLFNETLRFNLDPEAAHSDRKITDMLSKVGLWQHFIVGQSVIEGKAFTHARPFGAGEHPILDRKMSLFRQMSVGQCQLFALCRALVKRTALRRAGLKPVILLDEVTSSLDPATESIIFRIVNDEFTKKGHTVIIVAHRLSALQEDTVVGRDAVALMEDGQLVELIRDVNAGTLDRIAKIR